MTRAIGTCGECAWWCQSGAQIANAQRDPGAAVDVGTCQIDPPQTVKVVASWVEAVWPVTHITRFCGGWEPLRDPDGGDDGESEPVPDTVIAFDQTRRAA